MKKILKLVVIIAIFIMIINTYNMSFAKIDANSYRPTDIQESGDAINIPNTIIGAFQAIGSIVAVLALIFIGIKYMMGSAEEKAEFKQTAINYAIGAVLVFAISNISKVLYDFGRSLNN